jgi:hypothetical protein
MCRAAIALALLALAMGGCGSSGSEGSSSESSPATKKQFAEKAHAICYRLSKKQVRQMAAYGQRHGFDLSEPDRRQREEVNRAVVLPIVREKIEALGALAVPKGGEDEMEGILASMERGIRVSEAHPKWLAEPTAAHPDPFTETIELTAADGIWLCGQA